MTLQRIVDRLGQGSWRARLNALALSLALIAVGYGLFKSPEQPSPMWSQASAALRGSPVTVADRPADPAAAREPAAGNVPGHDVGIEAPRACAPDRGITEACIYN